MLKTLLAERKEAIAKAKELAESPEFDESTKAAVEVQLTSIRKLDEKIGMWEQLEAKEHEQAEAEEEAKQSRGRVSSPMKPDYLKHAEVSGFSLARAISDTVEHGGLRGIEKEVNQECIRRSGCEPKGNFYLPYRLGSPEKRALDTTTGTGAIPTYWESFIDLLRAKMIAAEAGARYLTGLKSTTRIPRQTTPATAAWVSESSAPAASNQAIDFVQLTQRTVGAQTQISRLFLSEATVMAESFVRDDLSAVVARSLDKAFFAGDGTGSSPTGILYTSGVGNVDFGGVPPTWANIVSLETNVAVQNALQGKLRYVTSPQGRGILKNTPKIGATYPIYLMDTDGSLNSYPVSVSTEIPATFVESTHTGLSPLVFGNFDDGMIGVWGEGASILVDPYSAGSQGDLRVYCLMGCDVALRHPVSFAYGLMST